MTSVDKLFTRDIFTVARCWTGPMPYIHMVDKRGAVLEISVTVFGQITAPALISAPPPRLFTLFSLIIAHLTIFFLTFYFIFTYYRPHDDLLALIVENKFTLAPRAPIRSNMVISIWSYLGSWSWPISPGKNGLCYFVQFKNTPKKVVGKIRFIEW